MTRGAHPRGKVLVVAGWYPSDDNPVAGVFVREQALAAQVHDDVTVLHPQVARGRVRGLYRLTESVEGGLPTIRLLLPGFLGPKLSLVFGLAGLPAVARALARRGFRPDVVHAHVFWAGLPALALGRLYDAPVIVTEHHTGFTRGSIRGLARRVARFTLRRADLICPVSADLERHLTAFGVRNRFRVVPNVVDTDLFAPNGAHAPRARPRALFVGAQIERKGVRPLLEALRRVRDEDRELALDVVGDGPERAGYEELAARLGLADDVCFHGVKDREQVASAMRAASFLVLPSLGENLPCVLIEALASGLPVVATEVGGVPEIVDDEAGLMVAPGDVEALATALERMVDAPAGYDPELLAARARLRYGHEAVARVWADVYREERERRHGASSRLKVLTLVDRVGTHGGAERLATQVARELDPQRFESTLCASRFSDSERHAAPVADALAELERAGARFLGLDRRSKLQLWAWLPLIRRLRRERVDVLHAHKFGSNAWGAVIGRLTRVPIVVAHEHTWSYQGGLLRRLVDRHVIARLSDAFIAVSREDRRRMIEVEGIAPEDVVLVANGIPDPPAPTGNDVRGELGIGPGDPVVGTVGFLRPQKALDVLIRAAAELAPRFPGLKVLIAGDGAERGRLEALIGELRLQDTVRLLGFRPDAADVVAAVDVAVCCSDYEGSPLSLMEYMDAARPIVATRVGGVPDLIEDGVHGVLVEPQDPAGLGAALAGLLQDPERAAELGRRARERRRREFALDATVASLERLYLNLYSRSRRGRREPVRAG